MPEDVEEAADRVRLLRSRFRGAFLGCMLGDALGRSFEMMSATDGRIASGLDAELARSTTWQYTDDTQMMIAAAESLVRAGRVSQKDLLLSLARSYDPARGYGHGMKLVFEAFRQGNRRPVFAAWAEGSKGNGGAVRIVPVACAYHDDVQGLAADADEAAGVTHAHELGRAGAVCHALAIAHVLRLAERESVHATSVLEELLHCPQVQEAFGAKLQQVGELVEQRAGPQHAAHVLGNGVLAEEAVPLALFAFLRWAPDFDGVVRNSILAGGDTDTTAAMSGSLCGALVGEGGLPGSWLDRLEQGAKWRSHVEHLADAVFDLWSRHARDARTLVTP